MDNVFDAINLMLSIIAICVSIHAIRITRVHNKLSVEPICAIIERYHEHNLAVVIVNRGLGAMIIDSVTVFKNDIERHNLIEFMPKVNQLWNGFSLEIKKRAILPDHELVLCAIDPESKEIRDQILSALADITITVTYHNIYGKTKQKSKTLSYCKTFLDNNFGYRAK